MFFHLFVIIPSPQSLFFIFSFPSLTIEENQLHFTRKIIVLPMHRALEPHIRYDTISRVHVTFASSVFFLVKGPQGLFERVKEYTLHPSRPIAEVWIQTHKIVFGFGFRWICDTIQKSNSKGETLNGMETLPKAQRTRGLSLYHKITVHSSQRINFKISTKLQHLD